MYQAILFFILIIIVIFIILRILQKRKSKEIETLKKFENIEKAKPVNQEVKKKDDLSQILTNDFNFTFPQKEYCTLFRETGLIDRNVLHDPRKSNQVQLELCGFEQHPPEATKIFIERVKPQLKDIYHEINQDKKKNQDYILELEHVGKLKLNSKAQEEPQEDSFIPSPIHEPKILKIEKWWDVQEEEDGDHKLENCYLLEEKN